MKLTAITTGRPLSTAAVVLTVVVLGMYGLTRLPVDFLPDMTYPLVKVHIWWRGATPDDLDRQLADPIERQMSTVDGLDSLESSSIEGMYTLLVNFRYGVNVDVAYQDVLAAMARVARDLPTDIDPPVVLKADPSQIPVLQLALSSDQMDVVKLRDWAERWLRDQLVAVPGVAGTEVVGGARREIRVNVEPFALERHGLGVGDLQQRIARENVDASAGRVTVGPREIIARTAGELGSLDELRDVVVARAGDARLRLGDVAAVEDSHEEIRVVTRLDGKPCVKLSVLKQAGANTVEVAHAMERRLASLAPGFPQGVRVAVVENQARYVEDALRGVRNAAVEAAVLLVVLMALFLGSWRQVVAMTWALPFTLLANFAVMALLGLSLNVFSVGGLVIAIAVDLDNSIIVIENVTRLRRERPELGTVALVVSAVGEVAPAVLASTLSFLALFLPFLLVPGLSTLLFRELILVVAGVMSVSLVNAVAVTPVIMALLLRGDRAHGETRFERWVRRARDGYLHSLRFVLGRRAATFAVFGLLLVVAGALYSRAGTEFLPRMDDGRVLVKVRLPTGVALGVTDDALRRVEEAVAGDPLVESAFTLAGGKVWGIATYEIANEGQLDLQLVPPERRTITTAEYVARLRRRLETVPLPAGKAMVMQAPVKGIRRVGESDLEVKVRGPDVARLFALARDVSATAGARPHLRNVRLSLDMTKPEYQVRVDRPRASALGLGVADVSGSLRALVKGAIASRYREAGEYYDVRVIVPERLMTTRRAVEELPVTCGADGCVRLRDVASVIEAGGPVEIAREDQVKQVVVRADVAGASVGTALDDLRSALATLELPVGYELGFGGQAQMMAEARRTLLLVVGFALFFAFVILVVQFDALRVPAIILATVPFSLAGLVGILVMTGTPLGATVVIGLLVVVAAHVTEGVLLLTYAEELRTREGLDRADAVVRAAGTRFRPRVMTALGVLAGLLPIALRLETGGDLLQPMALGAIGGLAVGIVVALYLMPALYAGAGRPLTPARAAPGAPVRTDPGEPR